MVNEDPNKIYKKETGVKSQQDETKAMLADELKEPEKLTTEEYFKDLEKTGKYPEELQELLDAGRIGRIFRLLRDKGVDIPSSEDELLGFLPKDKQHEIFDLFQKHFGTSGMLANYSGEGSQECTDGSDLYTLVKYNGKICLVKLAAGEFNRKTFTEGSRYKKAKFHKSPIPLFVVNQHDSYFAREGSVQANIRNIDVRLYLDLYAELASLKAGEAIKRRTFYRDKLKFFDWSQIKIPEYEELKSEISKTND